MTKAPSSLAAPIYPTPPAGKAADGEIPKRQPFTAQHQEMLMDIKTVARGTWLLFCAATLIGTFAGGIARAAEHTFTVAVNVSSRGLDLSQPADVQAFYRRVQRAAEVVCTQPNRVGLVRVDDYKSCYQKALANAIRSLKLPSFTGMYLEDHTLKQAEAAGIDLPPQVAAK
jgi:UrcA family protein